MSNINLPRVPPAKARSPLSGQGRKLLIVGALVAGALVGGRALSRRASTEAPVAGSASQAPR
jgi:hypothetical protein